MAALISIVHGTSYMPRGAHLAHAHGALQLRAADLLRQVVQVQELREGAGHLRQGVECEAGLRSNSFKSIAQCVPLLLPSATYNLPHTQQVMQLQQPPGRTQGVLYPSNKYRLAVTAAS